MSIDDTIQVDKVVQFSEEDFLQNRGLVIMSYIRSFTKNKKEGFFYLMSDNLYRRNDRPNMRFYPESVDSFINEAVNDPNFRGFVPLTIKAHDILTTNPTISLLYFCDNPKRFFEVYGKR